MDLPAYEPAPEPDRTPRDNPILAEPTTVADCRADYEASKAIRDRMDKQQKRTR